MYSLHPPPLVLLWRQAGSIKPPTSVAIASLYLSEPAALVPGLPVSMSVWNRLVLASGLIMFILVSCPISSALLGVKDLRLLFLAGVTWNEKPAGAIAKR